MTTYLFIWTILAGANSSPSFPRWQSGWINSGEFRDGQACTKVAQNLGIEKSNFRCINKMTGEVY